MSKPRRAAVALGGLLAGCHLVAELEGDYESVIPSGWQGPARVVESSTMPVSCPAGSTELGQGHRNLEVAATPCECVVPPSACAPRLLHWDNTSIALECLQLVPDGQLDLVAGTCVAVSLSNSYLKVTTKPLSQVLCENKAALAPPTWASSARLCSTRPTEDGICITRDGEQDCPAGPFTQRRVFYTGFDDQRSCDCGHAQGKCSGSMGIVDAKDFADPLAACQGNLVSSQTTLDACAGPVDARYVKYVDTASGLSCTAAASNAAAGDVVATDPITVCCRP